MRPALRWIAAAAWSVTSTPLAAQASAGSATVEISVQTRDGIPLNGATLFVTKAGGKPTTVRADSLGRVVVRDAEPGAYRVTARYIGFREGEIAIRVSAGRNTVPIVLDETEAPRLDTVRVVGGREVLARHADVEERRRLGLTTRSITREEIEKRNPVDAWQMLTNAPSVKIVEQNMSVHAVSSRGCKAISPERKPMQCVPCVMKVMIDEILQQDDQFDLARLPRPNEIYAIEVFGGPAQIPAKYGGLGADKICGLLAIWTR